MSKSDAEMHTECLNRFIDLANTMKNEGVGTHVISAAMMSASAVYANFVAVGNTGGLTESGVDKIVEAYRHQMKQVQAAKKAEFERVSQTDPGA
ncbi:DUF3144 domain-containing protein [Seongchinamella sediminis]|uniref:DUF3144 domain-containing protein n=1 Tax=Seongchinamella sediminis TaxID=2283635 RepID=A0A3L7DW00_9GAMM|nr:DUF3144 domain-containing protein [Seongchinamella sediminis]RLQ20729.1 DUF3144 domain-containing protein [Seongchinamella sediminis]